MKIPRLHPDFSAFIVSLTRHRVRFVVVGPIPFLGLDEMVRTKKAAGRTKDRLDLELLAEAGLLDAARLGGDE